MQIFGVFSVLVALNFIFSYGYIVKYRQKFHNSQTMTILDCERIAGLAVVPFMAGIISLIGLFCLTFYWPRKIARLGAKWYHVIIGHDLLRG